MENKNLEYKINEEKLYDLYILWTNQVFQDSEQRKNFHPKEIVYEICRILEKNPDLIQDLPYEKIL